MVIHHGSHARSRADLTLTLERKSEEHQALHSTYVTMQEQMQSLRAAAFARLGLPEDEAHTTDAPSAHQENQPAVEATDAVAPTDSVPTRPQATANAKLTEAFAKPLPKPLADALREPLRALDEAATKAIERGREGLARGLSDALSRLRPEDVQAEAKSKA